MQNQEMNYPTNNSKTIPQTGVIITVYAETPIKQTNQNPNPLKNTYPNAPPKTSKSTGYDRRAELLAYSRHLRNAHSSTTQFPVTKSKKLKWKVKPETSAAMRQMSSRRVLQRRRYERVGKTEVVDEGCLPKCFNGTNKKSTARLSSSIFRKLKSLVGELSKGCKRGGDDHR